jgi:hypothetical protein
MVYLCLVVIGVLVYFVYSLYKDNERVKGLLSALEQELLELPGPIHSGIQRHIVTQEMLNDITGGDITRLGKVAKKAETATTQHQLAVARRTTQPEFMTTEESRLLSTIEVSDEK